MLTSAPDRTSASPYRLGPDPVRTPSTVNALSGSRPILVTRKRTHPATIAYIDQRVREGKTRRDANRCLKRYLARSLYRLLENGPQLPT
jgi:hypothetical protein